MEESIIDIKKYICEKGSAPDSLLMTKEDYMKYLINYFGYTKEAALSALEELDNV